MIEPIMSMFNGLNTYLIILALIVVFLVAFKVLEMLMQTVLITVVSGGFYLALSQLIQSITFSLDTMLFFALLGGTLYTIYSLLGTSYKIASIALSIPIKLLNIIKGTLKQFSGRQKNKEEE